MLTNNYDKTLSLLLGHYTIGSPIKINYVAILLDNHTPKYNCWGSALINVATWLNLIKKYIQYLSNYA